MVKITFESFDDLDAPAQSTRDDQPWELFISDAAAQQVQTIMDAKNAENTYLRVIVRGGGCNGFNYSFALDDTNFSKKDKSFTNPNFPEVRLVVDTDSLALLKGSTIDYEDTLAASHFTIKNPNAKSSCGCGSSFSV